MQRYKIFLVAGASVLLLSALPAEAATKVVTAMPVSASLSPGESVLYDDKKCPAGQIAKFTKMRNKDGMKRSCITK